MAEQDDSETRRLDVELVRRSLAASRAQARAAIEAGKVLVEGVAATKPGMLVRGDAPITAEAAHPWVSRGGVKLDHALTVFGVDCAGRACLDVGASTGGFTDVLLARGARRVVAVDVGRDQLHSRLREDARVVSLESTDARNLTAAMLGEPPTLIVCDASFISLSKLLERALSLAAPGASLVALFKPQFEVGPANVGRSGIVSNQAATEAAAHNIELWLKAAGWPVGNWTESPIAGGDGNRERLLLAGNKP
ncbi:MAG: TlyA family rRNA (cytidine-2'-O)-methyltransferase [Alphaproteobacteria bacterium 32-64-14]|nr:MAG: TlyA family rRNA (cytidine-2'-O)-methyltransferase [Alphaproteobacteria bacterium 32-64-14]